MKLEPLTREQCQQVRIWRNNEMQFLRTPHLLTEKMQDDFFDNVVNNRDSKHRYFAIIDSVEYQQWDTAGGVEGMSRRHKQEFIGMGGLTNIEWENGTAEISLIINPEYRRQGKGREAVILLMIEALRNLRLLSVYGEVYDCGNRGFWESVISMSSDMGNETYKTKLVNRKYYNAKMHDSMWFSLGWKK